MSVTKVAHEAAYTGVLTLIDRKFPGADIWDWYRAVDAEPSSIRRRIDDASRDAAMAADADIKAAHDEYIRLLHIFYRARDGEHGFLGHLAPLVERKAP